MGILDNFRRRGIIVRVAAARAEVMGKSAEDLYRTQPALRAVISFLADNIASLPLKCFIRDGDNDRRRDTESDVALLLALPNDWTTRFELIRETVSDILLHNWALWAVLPSSSSDSGWAITQIPVSWIDGKSTVDGFTCETFSVVNPHTHKRIELDASDCIRFAGYDPDGRYEVHSPVESLKEILAEQVSAWEYRNSVWNNGGRVGAVIERPLGAEWSEGARDRFAKSWKNRFSGNDGTDTGGTPLLEDGMKLVTTQFNAREAEWSEVTRLSREDVAAAYHVNPSLIWHTDGQTYASAKDNARALYADTLAPLLTFLEQRINTFLLPKIGADKKAYVEFDMQAKLAASFEEQAQMLYSAVGSPYLVVNEARARLNLPAIEGGDELRLPLNTALFEDGSITNPNESEESEEPEDGKDADVLTKSDTQPRKSRGTAETDDAMQLAKALRKFFKRQSRSVLPKIESAKARGIDVKADEPEWWDGDRWDRELAADLLPILAAQVAKAGRRAIRDTALDGAFDPDICEAYVTAMAKNKARALNAVTKRKLMMALAESIGEDALTATPAGVFEEAEESRADRAGISWATAAAAFGVLEAVNQRGKGRRVTKTWIVTSGNPRAEHAALNGETVPYSETFSNGAKFPGDEMLTPEESCNCQCEVELTVW